MPNTLTCQVWRRITAGSDPNQPGPALAAMSKKKPSRSRPPAPRLALVMIVRNEAATIARCLRSARPWVDEMVVLDTGSTDDTVAIARGLGAQLHRSVWRDDFSQARNEALSHSRADWNLVLDADEWIAGGGGLLRQAVQQAASGAGLFVGLLPVHSRFNLRAGPGAAQDDPVPPADVPRPPPETAEPDSGLAVACSWLPRLLPAGVRYAGRVHEQPQSALPRRRLAVEIGHDGYLQHKLAQKAGRNRQLLQAALVDEPDNPYLHYQLGKDFDVYREYTQALPCYEQALHLVPPGEAYRHDLVLRMVYCLKKAGLLEIGQQFAEDEMANWPHSPDFFFVLADLLIDRAVAEPARAAADFLPLAEGCLLRCLAIGDAPQLEGAVQGRGSHLAARNLALVRQAMGRL